MPAKHRRESLLTMLVLVTVVPTLLAQNGSQFRDWKPSVLADAQKLHARMRCGSLVSLTGYEFSVVSAVAVPASVNAPAHCQVTGQIAPEIRFEVRLPAEWNGRLYMFGNGGYAGEALDAPARVESAHRALSAGFATAQTNTGHDAATEPLGSFAATPQKFLDYAFRAVHVTALTAKRISQAYYDALPRKSYFDGCSTGGRQGLISAQRFPEDFDGIVNGAPVLDFSGTMIDYLVNQRALAAAPLSPAKLRLVADAVYSRCDGVDGVKDGLIDDPRRCPFKPSTDLPRCVQDVDGPDCLTTAQIRTVEVIYAGVTRHGATVFPGWPLGAEIKARGGAAPPSGWMPWFVSEPNARPTQWTFGDTFFKYLAFGRPNASFDWTTFNIESDFEKLEPTRRALDATNPDLSAFKARGGKIVGYFGWADPALNPLMGVRYYESVVKELGPSTADFYRLFMVPGMFHCRGGVGPSTFDALTPLVEWVEKGQPPASLVGATIVEGKLIRTRPLCPYPDVAKYKGSGSMDDAANFACARSDR